MKTLKFVLIFNLILFLINGGITKAQWVFQQNPLGYGENAMLGPAQFVSLTEGWINGNGNTILHTSNAGNLWSVVKVSSVDVLFSISDPAFNLCFVNPQTGWVLKTLGSGFGDAKGAVLFYTVDGGVSWKKSIISQESGEIGMQLQFLDSKIGWASVWNVKTQAGKFYKTNDGGISWTLINNSIKPTDVVTCFHFENQTTGWLTEINDTPPSFSISKTTDGGVSWILQYMENNLNGVDTMTNSGAMQFVDENHGWVVGPKSRILKTSNGGTSWTKITNAGIGTDAYLKCLFALDANHVWIGVGIPDQHGNTQTHELIRTTDGGNSWSKESINLTNSAFSIFFLDLNHGWLTADLGVIAAFKGTTGMLTKENSKIAVWTENGQIRVTNVIDCDLISVFDRTGKLIKQVKIQNNQAVIAGLPKGFYLIRAGKDSVKIVL